MALFKKRSSDSSTSSAASSATPAPESAAAYADPLHRRARHRLIGASVLVVLAVLILPWVFDVKPPTVSHNVPIAIEGQTSDNTPVSAATAALPLTPAPTTVEEAEAKPISRKPDTTEAPAEPERAAKPQAAAKTEAARAEAPAARKPANIDELIAQRQKQERQEKQAQQKQKQQERAKPTPAAPAQPAAVATAPAAKPDQTTPPVQYNFPDKGRFVVQIGAYVEADKVANVRKRLSQAGLNNYTQQVTINGKKVTRVRLGPFTSRKQMEQVANKVRALGLPVSLYQL